MNQDNQDLRLVFFGGIGYNIMYLLGMKSQHGVFKLIDVIKLGIVTDILPLLTMAFQSVNNFCLVRVQLLVNCSIELGDVDHPINFEFQS